MKNEWELLEPFKASFYLLTEKNLIGPKFIMGSFKKLRFIIEQFLLQSKNNILFLIVNKFLTCKDVLILQKTCKFFKNLLQPQPLSNMIGFCNYADSESQHMTETTIIWDDVTFH